MATKKATTKKAIKAGASTSPSFVVIFILPNGKPHLVPAHVALNGQVAWQALIITNKYEIVLADPPEPFVSVPDPILTGPLGTAGPFKVDKNAAGYAWGYTIYQILPSGKRKRLRSGGSIIVDA
jgi:hypothetical protein